MTPVNLGDLPLTQPVPTGQAQVMYGSTNGAMNYTNASPIQPLTNGAGTAMAISVTPTRDCWWRVEAHTIWNAVEGNWSRADWGFDLSPADQDGWSRVTALVWTCSAVSWEHSRCTALYRLKGGITYTATMAFFGAPNGQTQQVYTGPDYHSICGHTYGECRA